LDKARRGLAAAIFAAELTHDVGGFVLRHGRSDMPGSDRWEPWSHGPRRSPTTSRRDRGGGRT